MGALDGFSPVTREWFTGAFATPTAAQEGAWSSIARGENTLVVAPTGSGKTLAAFLWAVDRLAVEHTTGPASPGAEADRPSSPGAEARGPGGRRGARRGRKGDAGPPRPCRVVYVSPLKALAVDVERNLRAPLTGIRQTALRMGLPAPDISVAIRSGDTAAEERRRFAARPSDILITTPESLFLILTSQAREALRGVETVIVDEVHAVAGTKRGAHLALTLERLDALLPAPAQRIGLSATVRPVEEVATFLGGSRPATVVQPPSEKVIEVDVVVPVEDMTELAPPPPGADGESPEHRRSIWPHVEEHLLDLIEAHRSTIVFANSRRLSERLCTRLNELAWERRTAPAPGDSPSPGDPAHWSDAFEELHARWSGLREDPDAHPSDTAHADTANGNTAHGNTAHGNTAHGDTEHADASWPEPPRGDVRRTGQAAMPSELMAQAGASGGVIPEVVRAHHGSVSKEERSQIEEALKSGRLPAVVATSSLELGIDMGSVDLVACVEAPPSVASGLQRIGRAGHQVGAVSRGVIFPKYRGDLVQTAVVAERMRAGQIEEIRYPRNPLDVLAQQIVAMTALDEWTVDSLETLVRRAAPYATLPRSALEATLDMLAGRYPSEEFAELRPRIVWDRVTGTLQGRPGAQRLAVTNGGTIPDRGLFGVFLVGEKASRVGELDEEMVYESRVGDVFVLGATSWRIEDITADRVLVSPAPGQPGKLPFWHGDTPGRPAELGRAIGAFLRELSAAGAGGRGDPAKVRERIRAAGLDDYAVGNLLAYLAEQREATGYVPDDRTLVVERFRDGLGDWRVVIHSPFGARVHAPWALAIGRRLRERYGIDVQAVHSDDGIVLRVPDTFEDAPTDVAVFDAEEIEEIVIEELGGSALFASRFRECAGRALLLPRRSPGRRSPLWQQRQRAAHLLGVASKYAGFPVVLETMRECLQDVFDVPGLVELMRDVAARRVRVVEVETSQASPFAASLLFNYIGAFMYEGDAPLAERRAQALALDTALLAELMGQADLRELLDPDVVAETERELARLDRPLRDAEDLADLLRSHGPLLAQDVSIREGDPGWLADLERARRAIRVRVAGHEQWAAVEDAWRLRDALGVPLPVGVPHEFLEAPLAGGSGAAGRAAAPDPLGDLVARHARTRGPFASGTAAARFGVGVAVVDEALRRLAAAGRVVAGEFRPGGRGEEWCDAGVLRLLRRRSLARLRKEVEPVPPETLAAFLPAWHGIVPQSGAPAGSGQGGSWQGGPGGWQGGTSAGQTGGAQRGPGGQGGGRQGGTGGGQAEGWHAGGRQGGGAQAGGSQSGPGGWQAGGGTGLAEPGAHGGQGHGSARAMDALITAIERLQGAAVPASALESLVLPARVPGYSPALLDELTSSGEVVWVGQGSLPGGDGWVGLYFADTAPLLLPEPSEITMTPLHEQILEILSGGGALFFRELSNRVAAAALGDAVPPLSGPDAASARRARILGRATGAPQPGPIGPTPGVTPANTTPDVTPGNAAADTVRGDTERGVTPGRATPGGAPASTTPDVRPGNAAADTTPGDTARGVTPGNAAPDDTTLAAALWDLVWAGRITGDTLAPLRSTLGTGRPAHRPPATRRRRAVLPTRSGPPTVSGRWWLLPAPSADGTQRAHAQAEVLLERHGVLTRGGITAERLPGGFSAVYQVLRAFEESGRCRRGYFVEGLGGAQFALPGAVDRMRAMSSTRSSAQSSTRPDPAEDLWSIPAPPPPRRAVVLAATDPANPYGAALPWPDRADDVTHKPGRKAGALVVLVEGTLILYVERGGKTLLSYGPEEDLRPAVQALAVAVKRGALGKLTVERADGTAITDSPLAQALEAAGFHPTPRGLRIRS
ncbi:DEAD/DEAH box helicase [Microbispora hainanensis]|uniref:DEAD/DEAH box helicase n=1 Tax=Microbispora hainanensis TaxID=568844 RepID=A0ABZ1SQR9_9ACTN|nr:DEAD/DEAH box helicase [Microbispora hainanensis]